MYYLYEFIKHLSFLLTLKFIHPTANIKTLECTCAIRWDPPLRTLWGKKKRKNRPLRPRTRHACATAPFLPRHRSRRGRRRSLALPWRRSRTSTAPIPSLSSSRTRRHRRPTQRRAPVPSPPAISSLLILRCRRRSPLLNHDSFFFSHKSKIKNEKRSSGSSVLWVAVCCPNPRFHLLSLPLHAMTAGADHAQWASRYP